MVGALSSAPFLFLRHAETAANADDTIAGSLDLPLTPLGERQAQQAARFIAALPAHLVPAAIWCSPLIRARRTAEPVATTLRLPLRLHPGLAERNWGGWEGLPRTELRRAETPPGGEGPDAFHARVAVALAALDGPPPILIVAHSGIARVLHVLFGDDNFLRPGNGELFLWQQDSALRWRPRPFVEASVAGRQAER